MTARKSFVLAHDLYGLHSEHTLPLTKAHVSSVGAVVGPTSAPFSAAVHYFLRHPPSFPRTRLGSRMLAASDPRVVSCESLSWQVSSYLPHPESRFPAAHSATVRVCSLSLDGSVLFGPRVNWMPVNCTRACDWLGAIQFLSKRFWFREYSAILETSNIYFASFILPSVLDEVKVRVRSKVHSSVAEEEAILLLFTVFCSLTLCLIAFLKSSQWLTWAYQFERANFLIVGPWLFW